MLCFCQLKNRSQRIWFSDNTISEITDNREHTLCEMRENSLCSLGVPKVKNDTKKALANFFVSASEWTFRLVAGPRIELGTSWLWIMRSNQLSYPAIMFKSFVEIEGLEPSLTEPESVVLPLHHISVFGSHFEFGTAKVGMFCKKAKYFWKNYSNIAIIPWKLPEITVCQCIGCLQDGRFRAGRWPL